MHLNPETALATAVEEHTPRRAVRAVGMVDPGQTWSSASTMTSVGTGGLVSSFRFVVAAPRCQLQPAVPNSTDTQTSSHPPVA